MKNLYYYITEASLKESLGTVNVEDLSNNEIKSLSNKLSKISKQQGCYVDPLQIQLSLKHFYGAISYIDSNNIFFKKIDGRNVMVINFPKENILGIGEHYYDEENDEWIKIN